MKVRTCRTSYKKPESSMLRHTSFMPRHKGSVSQHDQKKDFSFQTSCCGMSRISQKLESNVSRHGSIMSRHDEHVQNPISNIMPQHAKTMSRHDGRIFENKSLCFSFLSQFSQILSTLTFLNF